MVDVSFIESYTEYPIAGGTLASDDIIKTVNVPGAIVFGNHSYDQVHVRSFEEDILCGFINIRNT